MASRTCIPPVEVSASCYHAYDTLRYYAGRLLEEANDHDVAYALWAIREDDVELACAFLRLESAVKRVAPPRRVRELTEDEKKALAVLDEERSRLIERFSALESEAAIEVCEVDEVSRERAVGDDQWYPIMRLHYFVCSQCQVVEDTGLTHYWTRGDAPALCTQCDPTIGQWHGGFPRAKLSKDQEIGPDGLVHEPGKGESAGYWTVDAPARLKRGKGTE